VHRKFIKFVMKRVEFINKSQIVITAFCLICCYVASFFYVFVDLSQRFGYAHIIE